MSEFFGREEIARIEDRLKGLRVENVVYCSFENRYAKSGGLAAVTKMILPYLGTLPGVRRAILVSPFYPGIMKRELLEDTGKRISVKFGERTVEAFLLRQDNEYFLGAEGFFDAENPDGDPYLYVSGDGEANQRRILENALFYCKAVPQVLSALDIKRDVILHLQEWQTAMLALTAKEAMVEGTLDSCGCVHTLHNPYDCYIPCKDLELLGIGQKPEGLTAFQLGLPLSDAPLSTVSKHFAREFRDDILQTRHFAPHLQEIFSRTEVVGVNNGMFIPFPSEYQDVPSVTVSGIRKVKGEKRRLLLEILDTYRPPQRFGDLTYRGGSITGLPDSIPIFVMSGRLDYGQKGYDILLNAISQFEEDEIKVVLSPPSSDERSLALFRKTAKHCKGNLTVFPMRMEEGYQELQMGSTFGLMPSIYEPFGAAVEYMAAGTVTIARATGGLLDQIDDNATGLLFREPPDNYTIGNIRAFADTAPQPETRAKNPWAQDMAVALTTRLRDAMKLYRNQPDQYDAMILAGLKKALAFDWSTSASLYLDIYQRVSL
jgi:glycogen synthase